MASLVFFLDDATSKTVALDDAGVVTIGRHPDSVVVLTSPSVSGHHATIKRREKGFYVQDHGSSNGTRLNGAEIEEALLNDGDRVSYGDVQSVFYAGDAPSEEVYTEQKAKVAYIPKPDAPLIEEAPPVSSVKPPLRKRVSRRFIPSRSVSGYPDQGEGGCATAMFLTGLFIVAFFIGLALRHYKETDRSLMSDIVNRITKNMPKVKIERE